MIDFVNCLFAGEMGPRYEPLEAHRPQLGPTPAVEFLWAMEPEEDDACNTGFSRNAADNPPEGGTTNDDEGSPSERNRRREARWIARRLGAMVDGGEVLVWDKAATGEPAPRRQTGRYHALVSVR